MYVFTSVCVCIFLVLQDLLFSNLYFITQIRDENTKHRIMRAFTSPVLFDWLIWLFLALRSGSWILCFEIYYSLVMFDLSFFIKYSSSKPLEDINMHNSNNHIVPLFNDEITYLGEVVNQKIIYEKIELLNPLHRLR